MPRQYQTGLSLEQFRQLLGWHPFHFWQLSNSKTPFQSKCYAPLFEYAWRSADHFGRDDILKAIHYAEDTLFQYLYYRFSPTYSEETYPFPKFFDRALDRRSYGDAMGRWLNLSLKGKKVISLGVQTLTAIGDQVVVLSDTDGDGLNDRFTLTFATTVTEPSELHVYFSLADRFNSDPLSSWEVRPVKVQISGGTATITGNAWQIVKPLLYEGVASNYLDPDTVANFASTLAVYRVYIDPAGTTTDTSQIMLSWETRPYPWFCSGSGTDLDPAARAYAMGRAALRDAEQGFIGLAEAVYIAPNWVNVPLASAGYSPDTVTVRYYHGVSLDYGEVSRNFAQVIARLAMAEMPRPTEGCTTSQRELAHWQTEVTQKNIDQFFFPEKLLLNPLGTRLGHIQAWKFISAHDDVPDIVRA